MKSEKMQVEWEQRSEAAVARITGQIDGGNSEQFLRALQSGLHPEARVVVLDFEQVDFISSAGLRVLLVIAKQLKEHGAKIGLCSLSAPVRQVFEISGFEKVIPIHASQGEAISAFGASRRVTDAEIDNVRSSVDFDIVTDNVKDIAALTLEKYEYVNDLTLSEATREKVQKQMEDVLWRHIEQLKRRRLEILRQMFRLASKTLEGAVGGTDA